MLVDLAQILLRDVVEMTTSVPLLIFANKNASQRHEDSRTWAFWTEIYTVASYVEEARMGSEVIACLQLTQALSTSDVILICCTSIVASHSITACHGKPPDR